MVDAMGADGNDARFQVSRDQFRGMCSNQFGALQVAMAATVQAVFPGGVSVQIHADDSIE